MTNESRARLILPMLIITLAFVAQPILAIKCYICQSNVDPKCADPFDNITLPVTDCDSFPRPDLVTKTGYELIEEKSFLTLFGQSAPTKTIKSSICRKVRQKVHGEWRTIRGCGYLNSKGEPPQPNELEPHCEIRHGTYDIFMEVCTCGDKDGCNASVRLTDSISNNTIFLFILLSLLQAIYTQLHNN